MYRLKQAGFAAYLVGGSVRDILLGVHPQDFDVVTNAIPDEIRKLFRNSRLIGRRFKLVHVYFQGEVVEVATFRGQTVLTDSAGMIMQDNEYGTIEEDVWRRDFTINALYYNIEDFSIVDYVGGMRDLNHKIIQVIGDASARFKEDPLRMLRALRLAARLNFTVAENTTQPIANLTHLLANIPAARLFDETMKWFFSGTSLQTFKLLNKYGLFTVLFPIIKNCLSNPKSIAQNLLIVGFKNTDLRHAQHKILNPAFLFALILWHPLQLQIRTYQEKGLGVAPAMHIAIKKVLCAQTKIISIPQRLIRTIKEIWLLQYRIEQRNPKKDYYIFYHPRFRAAYEFLLLREQAGEKVTKLSYWWIKFQSESEQKSA